MKYTQSVGEKSTVKLTINFSEEEWQDAISKAYLKTRGKYAVPGFRKGIEAYADDWTLLFQLDTVEQEGFSLMFGDGGRIYFYIRKEDLRAKRFDRIWLVLQCY